VGLALIFLDDDDDLRGAMSEMMEVFGHECVCVASYEGLVALGERVLTARLAILDINLGPGRPSGLDAFRWLRAHRFAGAIVFLTGHARSHPLVAEATRMGQARLLEKPIHPEDLDALLTGQRASP
jgi:FixJ family two-component response regulator